MEKKSFVSGLFQTLERHVLGHLTSAPRHCVVSINFLSSLITHDSHKQCLWQEVQSDLHCESDNMI